MIGIFVFRLIYIESKRLIFIFYILGLYLSFPMPQSPKRPIQAGTVLIAVLSFFSSCKKEEPVDLRIKTISKAEIAIQVEAAKKSVSPELAPGLKMEVWAVDSLVKDPISIQVTDNGEVLYARSPRRNNSEFDIRGHQSWEIRSIALQLSLIHI